MKQKKKWRKRCDLTDLEQSEAEHRREEVLGTKACDKRNEQLFIIENKSLDEHETCSKKHGLQYLKSESNLHCDKPTFLPPPRHKKKVEQIDDSSSDEIDVPQEMLYRHVNHTVAKDVKKRGLTSLRKCLLHDNRSYDIWSVYPEDTGNQSFKFQKTANVTTKRPGTFKKPSGFANLELPHSGLSYNPTFRDHQHLLQKATSSEQKYLESTHKVNKKLKMTKMDHKDIERQWIIEMSEGLDGMAKSDDEKTNESITETVPVLKRPILASNKRTNQQRRKEKLRKQAILLEKKQKLEKIRLADVYRLRSLKKEIAAQKRLTDKRIAKRKRRKEFSELYRTKRIGKHRYQKPLIDVQLSSELCSSLRMLKAERGSIRDRFKSLQKRNMTEPTGPKTKTRYRKNFPRVKWVESRSYNLRVDS